MLKMEEVLPATCLLLDVEIADKARALSQIAAKLALAARIPAAAVEGALLAREALGSTGVGHGVGLPHARLHLLRSTHAVFFRLAPPIVYDSIDGLPVDLLCAVVAPDEPNADLLTVVSAFSRVLRDAEKTKLLRETTDPGEARVVLLSASGR